MATDLSQPDPKLAGGLEQEGVGAAARAQTGMESAALSESELEQYNARVKAQNKGGITSLVQAAGTVAGGAFGGPLGAALGGMAGGMVGGALVVLIGVCLALTLVFPKASEASMLTQMELHQLVSYDPETGHFT